MAIELGIKGSSSCTVTSDLTAKSLRSGGLDVLATPIMVALMEEAALLSVRPYLEPGTDTVGTRLDVSHLSATPPDMGRRFFCAFAGFTNCSRIYRALF